MDHSRIIRGAVGGGRYTVTAPITQWDYGYLFLPEIEDLPATYRLDFSNDEHHGTAYAVYGGEDGAEVPEDLIDTGKDIFVWFFYIGDGFGKSEYKWRIPNKCKPKTSEDEPTPSQQSSIDQLISVANEAIDTAQESASEASASAQSASADADRAEEARTDAQNYATQAEQARDDAQTYANNASASATASANSASQSAQIKTDVEGMVDDAQDYAQASAQSATASANSASQASASATSASQSATSAQGYASQAQTSAQTASSKASEASGYASTASAKATESAQSATNAQTYASQAESAKTASQTAQGLAESARDDAIDAKRDAESARDEAQSIVDGISAKAEQIDNNTADIESLEDDRYKPYVVDSASSSIASFPDGADDIPLKSLVVDINPVQSGTGDPSPDNVRPISGWTGANVVQTGINILDVAQFVPLSRTTIDEVDSNTGKIAFTATTSYYGVRIRIPIQKFAGKKVAFSALWPTSPKRAEIRIFDASENLVLNFNASNDGAFTIPANAVTFQMTLSNSTTVNTQIVYERLQIEVADSVSNFEPFGTTIPISWQTEAGTVYGGKLDVLTGKLTVYPYYASYNGETLTGEWISDRDVYAVGTTPTIGAQVVNIGAEGTEYQLEPHEVASLLGANNIFADTGDTTAEYRADTKLYIERLTAPDSADMIADANITSGQYFMVGNSLYKATANIASGGQVIVGTNAIRKSLSEALNEINA